MQYTLGTELITPKKSKKTNKQKKVATTNEWMEYTQDVTSNHTQQTLYNRRKKAKRLRVMLPNQSHCVKLSSSAVLNRPLVGNN